MPGVGRPQLGTPPGQVGQKRAREHRLAALGAPGPGSSLPTPPSFCLCWKRALKWGNRTCHLLANGSYPVPKVLRAWQSPVPKSWVHPPTPPVRTHRDGAWGWSWGGPREEGGSAHPGLPTPPSSSCSAPGSQAQARKLLASSSSEVLRAWRAASLGAGFASTGYST